MESTLPYISIAPNTTSPSADLDPYDAMILEYIDEEHIIALSLLPHLFPRATAQPTAQQDSSRDSPASSWNTTPNTTSNADAHIADVPVAESLNAATASVYPHATSDNGGRSIVYTEYRPVSDNTFDHTTTHPAIPLAQLDHFEEWRAYMDSLGQFRAASSDSWINIDANGSGFVAPLMAAGLGETV